MPDMPLKVRFKHANGTYSARVMADEVSQVIDYLKQWRSQGHTEFDIEDANGNPVKEADLNA